ncbi:hypothetical protein M3I53_22600 [Paraburkholderia sp. CNPSo 3272]|uniref:hypothetical protein n=1 Tax=Paraburkholderia sp. CNPSo 3272 TaxID=2940931 RepID=UPI0020B7E9F4|nr:hypothetical protein [Paraburkholderia sp. CNPSo 3272]MCP3725887.1 hypothetical protein [Paraburkholderia sp. CNPSo 3272]
MSTLTSKAREQSTPQHRAQTSSSRLGGKVVDAGAMMKGYLTVLPPGIQGDLFATDTKEELVADDE